MSYLHNDSNNTKCNNEADNGNDDRKLCFVGFACLLQLEEKKKKKKEKHRIHEQEQETPWRLTHKKVVKIIV